MIHQSAIDKIAQDKSYRPVNIPAYETVPLQHQAAAGPADDAGDDDEEAG